MIPVSPTRADIEGRLKGYMADYDADEGASLSFFNAIQDLKWSLARTMNAESVMAHAIARAERAEAALARFEDMARRVKDFQSAEADLRELRSEVVDKNGWDDDYYKMALHHAEQRLEAAELALLALQTETHDGK